MRDLELASNKINQPKKNGKHFFTFTHDFKNAKVISHQFIL